MPDLFSSGKWYCFVDSVLVELKSFRMKKNVGNLDRIVRLLISAILVVLYFTETLTGTLGLVALILAGVFTVTSIFGFCPLYLPLGISTCKTKSKA